MFCPVFQIESNIMDWRCVITCFTAGILQTVLVSSHFTAFPHEHPHKDNLYHNPQPQTYHPQPVTYHEPAQPAVEPHPVSNHILL